MAHYYDKQGRLRQIEMKTKPGQFREPNLRDAKRLKLAPGVTDVINIMAKPALETWKVKQGVLAAIDLDPGDYASRDSFVLDALARSKKETFAKADIGRDIHQSIEDYYRDKPYGNRDIVHCVVAHLDEAYGKREWQPETEFHADLDGYAYSGTADLLAGGSLVDVKTKEAFSDKMVYDEHLIQLALYRYALGADDCANLFVSYDGDIDCIQHSEKELQRGLKIGRALLAIWYAVKMQ